MKRLCLSVSLFFSLISFSQNSVGIGTTTPHSTAKLQVDVGNDPSKGFLVTGVFQNSGGTVPDLGAGPRMFFYPGKFAFRAGYVNGTQWDDNMVAYGSFASGAYTIASGRTAVAMGEHNSATGDNSTALGYSVSASGTISTAMGAYTNATGGSSTSMGFATAASGFASTASGDNTIAAGNASSASGYNTRANGYGATAAGVYNIANGFGSLVVGNYNDPLLTIPQNIFQDSTPLFLVGNGNQSLRKNALVVKNDGFAAIGNNTRNGRLSILHTSSNASPALLLYDSSSSNFSRLQFQNSSGNKFWQVAGFIDNAADANSKLNFFHSINGEVMTLAGNGNIGIGTTAPATRLDVGGGNNWDLANTEGDVRIGTSSYRLKFGVATSGGGAGAANIMQYGQPGGFNVLSLGAQGNSILYVNGATTNVGIGTSSPSQKLQVVGNICATGTIGACSDIRYKTALQPLTSALTSVMKIQPIYYYWKPEFKDKGFTSERQLGFSAQEIEQYFPEIVQTGADGYKAVDYSRMTPVLVQAVKEQQQEINDLKKQNAELLNRLERLEKAILK